MFSRPLLFLGVLAAAVVVPYVMLDENLAQTARSQLNRLWGKSQPSDTDALAKLFKAGPSITPVSAPNAMIEEAFRFEITPAWISSRWPRVSTVLGEPKQLGMRVALVSGMRPDDIAGSLTYYFDEYHQLQRITFTGLTGDARRLLAAVIPAHDFKSQPTTGAAHYIAGDPKKPVSEVIVRHVPILRQDATNGQLEVSVDLRRPSLLADSKGAPRAPEPTPLPTFYRRW